jgi:hypothetical protein
MIRQLQRLTRPLPAAGPRAAALAIYAEAQGNGFAPRVAAESGFEGVACVDDAARAALLYTRAWRRFRLPAARAAAESLFDFLAYMQDEQGRFVNFVLDWEGRLNTTGPTSFPAGWAWQARAMHALAAGAAAFGSEALRERFERGLAWLDRPCPYHDVTAVCVLAALELWQATGSPELRRRALGWSERIAAARQGDLLPDVDGDTSVHLWGHLQEAALARIGQVYDRSDLVEIARRSAEAVWVEPVRNAFAAETTVPFDVSSGVQALAAVASATGQQRYARLASLARAWFHGRNAAGEPMYDTERGLAYDGIDNGVINRDAGAESNIEAGLALLPRLPREAFAALDQVPSSRVG